MHYAYFDGKRVSNHLMRDYRTFLKLQEGIGFKQVVTQGSIRTVRHHHHRCLAMVMQQPKDNQIRVAKATGD
jgi:hypothetical protein